MFAHDPPRHHPGSWPTSVFLSLKLASLSAVYSLISSGVNALSSYQLGKGPKKADHNNYDKEI
jgi:hypothetical protein